MSLANLKKTAPWLKFIHFSGHWTVTGHFSERNTNSKIEALNAIGETAQNLGSVSSCTLHMTFGFSPLRRRGDFRYTTLLFKAFSHESFFAPPARRS